MNYKFPLIGSLPLEGYEIYVCGSRIYYTHRIWHHLEEGKMWYNHLISILSGPSRNLVARGNHHIQAHLSFHPTRKPWNNMQSGSELSLGWFDTLVSSKDLKLGVRPKALEMRWMNKAQARRGFSPFIRRWMDERYALYVTIQPLHTKKTYCVYFVGPKLFHVCDVSPRHF